MKPIRGGLLSALGAAFILFATPAISWAAFPGANGLIAYSQAVGNLPQGGHNWEIFTISPAGGDPTRLTDNAISDFLPSWSADGRRLAFIRASAYFANVWTMRADGTHQRQVTHGSLPKRSPSFSPGGGRIVMTRGWNGGMGNIVIVRTDGTKSVRLTSGRWARDPAFSPNGRRIVFAGAPREEAASGIWVMRRDGTHKRLLAADPNSDSPDFDPDGSHIVFHRLHNCISHGCDDSLILMRSNGRRKRVIREIGDMPVFSPTGKRIAEVWVSCDALTERCNSKLLTVDRDETDARVVTDPEPPFDSIYDPSWQPIPQP